ncbi:MAG: hypothetical protein ACPGLV_06040 [Bacteroidia bacterium]
MRTHKSILSWVFITHLSVYGQCPANNGSNLLVKEGKYPYTTFFRNNPNGSFNCRESLDTSISNYRAALSELINDGKGDPTKDKDAKKIFDIYEGLYTSATPVAYEDPTKGESIKRKNYPSQMKAKGFILLSAIDTAGNNIAHSLLSEIRTELYTMFETINTNGIGVVQANPNSSKELHHVFTSI